MTKHILATLIIVFFCLTVGASVSLAQYQQPSGATPAMAASLTLEAQQTLVDQYCVFCHDDVERSGGMSMAGLDLAHVESSPELVEKMIRKLRAGLMPPARQPRPDVATLRAFVTSLEKGMDREGEANLNPGRLSLHRLNRAEYVLSVRDLLQVDVDVAALLPPDSMGYGFDNTADALGISPALVEGYIRAAGQTSRAALGDLQMGGTSVTYDITRTASQMRQVEGAPFGTRGGISVIHNFPADGEYTFTMTFYGESTGGVFGLNNPLAEDYKEEIEISIEGRRVSVMVIENSMNERDPAGLTLTTGPISIKAGPQRVSAAFIQRFMGLFDDLIRPIEHTIADQQVSSGEGISTLPHLQELNIKGPYNATGVSETPSRARIFSCRPTSLDEEEPCASEIISDIATQAYRRPVSAEDLEGLISFYKSGREGGDFESGIRTSVQAILASPGFVFRFEQAPPDARPGQNYRITELELASRLSFFLWSTGPDEELMSVARGGRLSDPAVLEQQVARMLEHPRSEALSTRFGGQWLGLGNLEGRVPDPILFPQFDMYMGQSMRRETELFFDSIVREDRNVLDLLTADYTFVDERLAKHYKIPNVLGNRFRRVAVTSKDRRGLLGHASVLTITSNADRTSAVQRGKWVMETLLGSPPPTPPPNVPKLEETDRLTASKVLTLRERMEEHRANPTCAPCHRMIDPIGLALENFDATGRWREQDGGAPIDTSTELFDGTQITGPSSLREAILTRSDAFIQNFTENLLVYALGRKNEYYDMPTVRTIASDAAKSDNQFSAFVLGVVRSPAFQMRQMEETTDADQAGGQR
jgi:hypothetical protein